MTLEEFNEIGWRPGMSVVYKFRNVDSPTGESVRETTVARVEFDEGDGYAGILGPKIKGTSARPCVLFSQIIEVKYGEKS